MLIVKITNAFVLPHISFLWMHGILEVGLQGPGFLRAWRSLLTGNSIVFIIASADLGPIARASSWRRLIVSGCWRQNLIFSAKNPSFHIRGEGLNSLQICAKWLPSTSPMSTNELTRYPGGSGQIQYSKIHQLWEKLVLSLWRWKKTNMSV